MHPRPRQFKGAGGGGDWMTLPTSQVLARNPESVGV
jgi:hypothetical protein